MAKLKAPLLSLGATGAIGKSIVFFNWKGLDVAREYVVPANPKTDPQTTQRGYLTLAVTWIHAAESAAAHPMLTIDQTAYALWAATLAKPLTWFNMAVRNCVNQLIASLSAQVYRGATLAEADAAVTITVYSNGITVGGITAGNFHYGVSKTNLINTIAATVDTGEHSALKEITGLTNGTKYYFQFRPTVPAAYIGNYSGIYHATPAA